MTEQLQHGKAPEGFKLRYILGRFRETAAAHGLDWSLPTTSQAWRRRLSSGCYISATGTETAVADGHFFLPSLFLSSHAISAAENDARGFLGSFKLVHAQALCVLPEGKPASTGHAGKAIALSDWTGVLDRGTWILAAPIDCVGISRPELAVAATAGELCLLKTRDLVYNLIGDKRNTGASSADRPPCVVLFLLLSSVTFSGLTFSHAGLTSNSKLAFLDTVKQHDPADAADFGPAEAFLSHTWRDSNSKLTFLDTVKRHDPADAADIGPAEAFLSHTWGDCFCDTVEALLPTHDQCYRAMVEPAVACSLLPLLRVVLHALVVLCVPFVGWLILPILGSRQRVLDHMSNPRWWTPRAVVALAETSFWIDIFCKNQHVVNSGDTAMELAACVKHCGRTVLACSPWHDPTCLRRIWCQFEVHHTYLAGTTLDVRYPDAEKKAMESHIGALFRWPWCAQTGLPKSGSLLLGEAIASLKVTNARATVASDRATILLQIAGEFGGQGDDLTSVPNVAAFDKFDSIIRTATIDGIVAALGGSAAARSVAEVGERRPRQVPWAYRVAMYSFAVQLLVVLIMLTFYKLIPQLVLPFVASAITVVLACMFINMATKSTNLLQLLQHDPRARVLRRERALCLCGCAAALGLAVAGVYFGTHMSVN